MALIFALLRASHARGTHHYLALDALDGLAAGEAWQRLFYKHIATYLDGSKAPDTAFKDFKNHVLHPRDGFWGGAPEQAATWYRELVTALQRRDWPAAAYAGGVLSHYCSDPCMPLHTHQSAAENNVHAALEWTVSTSYARLRTLGDELQAAAAPHAGPGDDWLADMLRAAATAATAYYETLLTHYDITRGVVAPEEGLDAVGQRAAATMLRYARMLFALVLDRAFAEAAVVPEQVSLAGDALRAFVSMPAARRRKRLEFAADRRLIEAMYDELMATGRVELTLRDDERRIQELYEAEVLAAPPAATPMTATPERAPAPQAAPSPPRAIRAPAVSEKPAEQPAPAASANLSTFQPAERRPDRARLSADSPIVDAPSIGPRTAARLNAVGIDTVDDFLKAHPIALAARLEADHLTAEALSSWQDQARLMLRLPGMRGGQAQLLVGAGYRTLEAIAAADPGVLCADVMHFALSTEGARLLREGHAPDLEQIKALATEARAAKAA